MTTHFHQIKGGKKASFKDFMLSRYTENRTNMEDLYRSWLVNLAWIRGYQNYDYHVGTQKFIKPDQDPWRTRLQSNLMLPLVRKNVAKIHQAGNVWDVIPATPDEDDIQIARTASGVLQNAWQQANMAMKTLQVAYWQESVSSCFLKVGWDAEKGDPVQVETNLVETDLLQQFLERSGVPNEGIPEHLDVQTGELFIDVVSPFNIMCDPMVNVFENTDYIIETRLRSKDWIIEKYGNKWKSLTENSGSDLFMYPYLYSQQTRTADIKGVLIHEFMAKESNKFKNGKFALMTHDGQFLLDPTDLPFEHGELPYAHFVSIFDPVSMWGTCVSEQIRSNQARYNASQSAITDTIRLMSKPQWLNPTNSGVKSFTNRPGEIITYRHPFKPDQTQPKPLPAYVTEELFRIKADIQETSSTHDVTQGKAEPGIRSGRAVLALQDADDSVLGPTLLQYDNALTRTGRLALQTISEFTPEDKIISIRGEFNELETLTFNSDVLQGKSKGADYWQVRVKTTGRQSMSRAGREQLTRTLIELGLLNPQVDRDLLMHILGSADITEIYEETEIDRTRQSKEIERMLQGQDVDVIQGEDHQTHIRMIRKFIASSRREKASPQSLQLIIGHLDNHMIMQASELAKQQSYLQGAMQQQGVQQDVPQQTQ